MEYFENLHYKDKVHLSGNARTVCLHRQWGTCLILIRFVSVPEITGHGNVIETL